VCLYYWVFLTCLCYVTLSFKVDQMVYSGNISVCSRLCAGERTGLLFGIVFILLRPVTFRPFSCLMCFSFSSLIVYYAPGLFVLRAGHMRVFIIFGNTLISSYFGWRSCLCILQPPTVYRRGFRGQRCYWLAVNQGVRVLSLTTVREARFADLATLRAQT